MNLKTTYILFGALVLVLLVFAATQFSGCQKAGTDKETYVFADFHGKDAVKAADVDAVRVERPAAKETLAFTHGKDGWQMTEPYPLRTDTYLVSRVVDEVADARPEQGEIGSNPAEYGLTDPRIVVTLKKGDREWKLNVGNETGANGVVYVSTGAKPNVPLAVQRGSLDAVFKTMNDFRSKDLLTANATNTSAMHLDAGDKVLALDKTGDGRWRFQKPPYGPANYEGDTAALPPVGGDKKITGVHELLDDAGGLRVETEKDFVAQGVGDAELADKYGLDKDKPATLRVEAKVAPPNGEAKTEVLLVGKKAPPPEEVKETKSTEKEKKPDAKAEYYYARLASENAVVRVPAAKVKPLLDVTANPDPLRSRDLVSLGSTAKIDAVDVQAGGSTVKLRQADNKWTLYYNGARATDAGAVRELIDAITGKKKVLTFVDKPDGLDFDKPAAVVSVWIDGVKKEEKKDEEKKEGEKKDEKNEAKEPGLSSDKPSVKLTFGKRDRDKNIVYVQREAGEDKTFVTVSDSVLEKVTAGPLTYADRQLPTFAQGFDMTFKDVTKLALERGGQAWEVTKETAGDKTSWKITQPKEMAGRNANAANVGAVLGDLAHLHADKVVAEKPKDDELGPLYGLKPPVAKATVTVTKDGKPEGWVYNFGKQSDTKMGVYAQLSKSDFVFLVPKATLDRLETTDLRDPAVFNFDMAKVKGAKISGWSGVLGSVYTLDLQRKGDKDWAATAPPNYTADGAVVESFISGLSHLQASRFVTPKADPELDVNKGALQVEITVEGEKEPLRLTVGKEDPDNKEFYFARSSTQGDAVFLVPKLSFEKAKEKPAYFKKG